MSSLRLACHLDPRFSRCRGLALATILAACAASSVAAPQQKPGDRKPGDIGTDQADIQWAHEEGSALLVLEPPALAGASRWAIESPRHRGDIICLALAPDGARVATGGVDGVVRIWNLADGALEKAFAGHSYDLHTMAWSPDGKRLATNAWGDLTVKIWNVASGTLETQFKKNYRLRSLRWSPDGKRLAGGTDGSGRIFVSDELAEPRVLAEQGQAVRALDWSPAGTQLAVSTVGGPVAVLDARSGKPVYALAQDTSEATHSVRFSPDGSLLATGAGKVVGIWNAGDGKQQQMLKGACAGLCWSPDGTQLAVTAATGLAVWNVGTGKPAWKQSISGGLVDWSAESGRLLVGSKTQLLLRDGGNGAEVKTIDAGGRMAPLFQAGRPVITGIGTPVLSLWDPNTLKRLKRIEGQGNAVTAAAWSRDGKQFATADAAGVVRSWDPKAWTAVIELKTSEQPLSLVEWSPDGKLLAAAGSAKTVWVWAADGELEATLEGHARPVRGLAWAPGGRQLASGAADGELIVWDVTQATADQRIASPVSVTAMAWATVRAAPALAVGGADGSIRIWHPGNGEMLGVIVDGHPSSRFATDALGWLQGNKPLLLSTRNYLTQAWDVATSRTVQRQMSPGGGSAVFPTARGSFIVNRCGDRTVRFWEPANGLLRATLLEEGDSLVAFTTTGDIKFDPDVPPGLIAIVETTSGQETISLDELAKKYGWKNQGRMIRLPAQN